MCTACFTSDSVVRVSDLHDFHLDMSKDWKKKSRLDKMKAAEFQPQAFKQLFEVPVQLHSSE